MLGTRSRSGVAFVARGCRRQTHFEAQMLHEALASLNLEAISRFGLSTRAARKFSYSALTVTRLKASMGCKSIHKDFNNTCRGAACEQPCCHASPAPAAFGGTQPHPSVPILLGSTRHLRTITTFDCIGLLYSCRDGRPPFTNPSLR